MPGFVSGCSIAFLIAASLVLFGRPASAVLLVGDLNSPADGLLTLDTGSGLEWLDWAVTDGMSVNQVEDELESGGMFDSFRYATNAEVITFWLNAGIPNVPGITLANLAPVQALVTLLGVTFSNSLVTAGSIGFTNDVSGALRFEANLADRTPFDGLGQATLQLTIGITDASQDPSRGHALVRPIPEPASAVLLLAGLCGVAFGRGWIERRSAAR